MNRGIPWVLLAALALSPAALADLQVEDGYVRGLPPGTPNTAAYMRLRNSGTAPVELVGASAEVAGSVMLHTTMDHGGVLHMQHLSGLTIPAGGEVVLQSGGIHLMLMDLEAMPQAGTVVAITLEFADGTTQDITLPVRSVLDE